MAHVKALGIKLLFTSVILLSLLIVFDSISIGQILLISIFVTSTSYLIGDICMLPVVGSLVATVIDFTACFVFVWLLSGLFVGQTTTLVLTSVGIAYMFTLCETLFHKYMRSRVLPKKLAIIIPFPGMKLQADVNDGLYHNNNKKK